MTFTKLPKAISAEELLSTPLPPVKWIIPGLLPAGLALFAGPSKAGKSWLTLWLCLQIAQGNPVWNREIEPRTVIYFSLEDTFNRLQNRIFQLIDGGDAPERLILQTECPSIGQGLEEQIESLILTYRDVDLIVIDTLQKVRVSDGNGGMYANDYKEAGALKKLADKYGICILLIHHLRKQSAADPFDQISGSTGLMGVADTSWVMQRKRMSQTADILLTGRDMDDRTLHLREENCVWTLEDEETAEEREIKAVCRTTCGKRRSTSKVSETGREQPPSCLQRQVLKMPNRTSSPTTWRSISIKYLNRKTSDIKPIEKTRFAF